MYVRRQRGPAREAGGRLFLSDIEHTTTAGSQKSGAMLMRTIGTNCKFTFLK